MYRVLIADDEQIIREGISRRCHGLRSGLNWQVLRRMAWMRLKKQSNCIRML